MTTLYNKQVGKVIRVEWDDDTGEVRIVMEITDPKFKKRILQSTDYQDILSIKGKDVMIIASKPNKETK